MEKDSKIWVAGHTGLVGSAVVKELTKQGYTNVMYQIDAPNEVNKRYDLRNANEVHEFFAEHKPEYVILAAAKVGGIHENNVSSGEMIFDNLSIQTNVIAAAHKWNVKKLLFLGSSCIYPKFAKQPIKEEYLMTGELEQTNIGYAVAKIAGLTMCEMYRKQYGSNFISAMPTNLYGPGDNFHPDKSHVLPGMMRRFHDAKKNGSKMIEMWGSGTPYREFLYIDDLANSLVFLMNNYDDKEIINVGTGEDIQIEELAHEIKDLVDFEGTIIWDASKPDGTPKKLLDVSKINKLGWKAETSFNDGLNKTYEWFKKNYNKARL